MKYSDIVSFRKDLLFEGAVQINWFESNEELAKKAAEHYVFHGPTYHGAEQGDFKGSEHVLFDTANFTLDILNHASGLDMDEPFALAIAGYGTGKSHLGVTLASLFSDPRSHVADRILKNIELADKKIGGQVGEILENIGKPFIVVAINGMKDFYLCGEIIRQILSVLNSAGVDTSVLKNLRPRFKVAANFTESFYEGLKDEFHKQFGQPVGKNEIINLLNNQDESVFKKVNSIYEERLAMPIPAAGQEALHEFITETNDHFCGPGKPFAGIVILFDEFGRYLEFAVERPHIAGSGALQQLFEAVQENSDNVFLLGFIQYELRAYISRIVPELREDLNRYVSRYDMVRKVRLSSNLETLIANLFEKKNLNELRNQVAAIKLSPEGIMGLMKRWFPEVADHALWVDQEKFKNVIVEGCWPLHPLSTWALYKLASVGKSFQERSALSFLVDAFNDAKDRECMPGELILPVELCNEKMIDEFLSSEQYGKQGAIAHAYKNVLDKYQYEIKEDQEALLKAVLLSSKIGFKVDSREDCLNVLSLFSGVDLDKTEKEIRYLESEYAVLEWNDTLNRFDIAGDSVPKKAFIALLNREAGKISSKSRSEIFAQNYMKWSGTKLVNTDFGAKSKIYTGEWNYQVSFTNFSLLKGQINYALSTWVDARGVDEAKGQLIYCYVGPESTIEDASEFTLRVLDETIVEKGLDREIGAPLAIILLHDEDGSFGQKIAESWVIAESLDEEERLKYQNFILDLKDSLKQEMALLFSKMESKKHAILAVNSEIKDARVVGILTRLFDVIYAQRIPFPFDGFHTAKGHAARDCKQFTSQLLLGRLDREWIAAQGQQQRNRAYEVLDKSWGVLGENGLVRINPTNKGLRNIIELVESKLPPVGDISYSETMNLGVIMRQLCAPPYGLNLASAGLVIAMFLGKRKDEINLFINNNKMIGIENWLQGALKGWFFDLTVLDKSYITRVDKESLSEWESLLENWEDEKKLLAICNYLVSAERLQENVPVPPQLHYRFKLLQGHGEKALKRLGDHDDEIDSALQKIKAGLNQNDVGKVSWGGADLIELLESMNSERELWADDQIKEIEDHVKNAIKSIEKGFGPWLKGLSVVSIEHLSKFKHINKRIAINLEKLGLLEKRELLENHVEQVAENIEQITKINRLVSNINNMVMNNQITDSTPVLVLNSWIAQAREFEKYLELVSNKKGLLRLVNSESKNKLKAYILQCKKQLILHKERMRKIYDIQSILDSSDLEYWRREAAALKIIYDGHDRDLEDLEQVLQHLNLIETHMARLNDYSLSLEEFAATCERCIEETEKYFIDDAPPLDYEGIYDCLKNEIIGNRKRSADEWVKRNLPDISKIAGLNAAEALQIKTNLLPIPQILSEEQVEIVKEVISVCGKRLDELEVEGLLARFKVLSVENRKRFIELAYKYLK